MKYKLSKKILFSLIMLLSVSAHSSTISISYSTSDYSVRGFPGINGFWSSWLDIDSVNRTGNISENTSLYGTFSEVTYTLNSYYNEYNTYGGFTATRSIDVTIDSIVYSSTFTQNYQLRSSGYFEFVDIFQGDTFTLDLGVNGLLDITPSNLTLGTGSSGSITQSMGVNFYLHDVPAIPIPPSIYLFISGLIALAGLPLIRPNN